MFSLRQFRQAINLNETAVGLNKRRLIQSAVVKELVRVNRFDDQNETFVEFIFLFS